MKLNLIIKIITGITICAGVLTTSRMVEASSDKYSCTQVEGIHGIYSHTEQGKIRYMNFTRHVSEEWTIAKRCDEVAKRFQRFYDNDILRYIGADHVNNEPVLCAVVERGERCNLENVLVTLPPKSIPKDVARQLMDLRELAAGRVIDVNGKKGKVENYVNGVAYYDLEALEQLILADEDSDRLIPHE